LKRFYEEAKVGARIASEHIVEVHSAGVDQGTPYLVMELLRGETLAERLVRAGPLAPVELVDMADQLAHALDAAHRAGVIHCDLKPDNIFFAASARVGASRTVKVLDFGIATLLSSSRASAPDGPPMGSPHWMSLEQFTARTPTAASDLWAFGLVTYFSLTVRRYWHADGADLATLVAELRTTPRDPEARALAHGRALPRGFDAWFDRCLAVDPRHRWPTCADAARALHALSAPRRAPEHTAEASPVAPKAGPPWARRRVPGWAFVLGGLTVPLLGALAFRSTFSPSPAPEPPQGAAQRLLAGGQAVLADQRRVTVAPFWLDRTEVSVDAYAACVRAGRCAAVSADGYAGQAQVCNAQRSDRGAHPMNCLSLTEARAYCAWRGARLATEAEWSLAAHGADGARAYPWGDAPPSADRVNLCGPECLERTGAARAIGWSDSFSSTAPVDELSNGATPEGVVQLYGNVAEWVECGLEGRGCALGGGWLDPVRDRGTERRVLADREGHRSVGLRCARSAR
ncbi:MAG: SUMF1/EgtB/PvdO family nonheme iron enzyme, partial [Myxococcales bacterium]|nr:SUMF1/EgtB/PvdO family nonheme iron enzyme [Myxococcales bacterium]